jgi:hypothetical protein
MGREKLGDGRGRWYRWETKPTVGDYLRLNVVQLARAVDLEQPAAVTWRWSWGNGQQDTIYRRRVARRGGPGVTNCQSRVLPLQGSGLHDWKGWGASRSSHHSDI